MFSVSYVSFLNLLYIVGNGPSMTKGCRYNLHSMNVCFLSDVVIDSYKQACFTADRSLGNSTKMCVHEHLYMYICVHAHESLHLGGIQKH